MEDGTERPARTDDGSMESASYLPTLRVIYAELDRFSTGHRARLDSLQSRAALLVTGSAVLAGIAIDTPAITAFFTVILAGAGAALGIFALWPRSLNEVWPSTLRESALGGTDGPKSEIDALRELYDTRAHFAEEHESQLRRMARFLKAGFVALGLAITPLALQALAASGAIDWYLEILERTK